ncbi:sigma-70 family RNA polymerase sigma factor [Calycomorphotria hydatis]|uniref:RNA polymerase sigma factor n=1 Tax=Calycomorphotria hydatis TaxID=2528027 RepID=A0A517T7Z7_9PLAN|nr:sigma-70 family RNA polymerase sigma factor [Calycomorphotria hydatis]QDT64504.1 RNA polymerase sigma factor [Calycomorphotria hydatis]
MEQSSDHTLRVQQLFVHHQSQLKAFAFALCSDFVQADDLMQEAFLTVSNKAHEFDLESNFLAWSRAIVRFKLLEARRASGAKSVEYIEALAATCPENWADEDRLQALTKCLGALAPKAREIVTLRYKQEYSPVQIAELLSRTVNSINVALSKARTTLRLCMDQQLKTEGQA